jgi:mRNA interferase HigB
MKINVVTKHTLDIYAVQNSQSRGPLNIWLEGLKNANWKTPGDIISTFNSSDLLGRGSKRVVFNIGGNKYRLICKYHFGNTRVNLYVMWIGTHSEYTNLCKLDKQYLISDY